VSGGLVSSHPLAGLGVTQQLYGSGTTWMEREIRHGGPSGNTYANGSKYNVETEHFNKYLRLLAEKDIHPIVSSLAKWDTTPGRTELEKYSVADQRLRDTLEQFGKGAHPDVVFSIADTLRESAGVAIDAVEALAGEARKAGNAPKAHGFDQSLNALRMDTASWTRPMLMMRSRAKRESGGILPHVFVDRGVGEATRVQSLMPWTKERFGLQAGKAGMPFEDQSDLESSSDASPEASPRKTQVLMEDTEGRWFDNPAYDDEQDELENVAEDSLRQWRLAMHGAVDAVPDPVNREGVRQALQSELAAEAIAADTTTGSEDDEALATAITTSGSSNGT
jgi:hypothetical protein